MTGRGMSLGKATDTSSRAASEAAEPVWNEERLGAVHDQADKAQRVRRMFNAIAPTYELINTMFSGGRDRAWRKKAVRLAAPRPGAIVLDVACGTGDFLRAFERWAPRPLLLVGADFAHSMLVLAMERSSAALKWSESDALRMPFAAERFDVVSCAFGVRNFQDLDRGLREMHRVLRPGGRAVILEFTRPSNRLFRAVYELYCGRIMPRAAAVISRDRTGAYRYLPSSVVTFMGADEMCKRLTAAGFAAVLARPLTFGAVTVYVAAKGSG